MDDDGLNGVLGTLAEQVAQFLLLHAKQVCHPLAACQHANGHTGVRVSLALRDDGLRSTSGAHHGAGLHPHSGTHRKALPPGLPPHRFHQLTRCWRSTTKAVRRSKISVRWFIKPPPPFLLLLFWHSPSIQLNSSFNRNLHYAAAPHREGKVHAAPLIFQRSLQNKRYWQCCVTVVGTVANMPMLCSIRLAEEGQRIDLAMISGAASVPPAVSMSLTISREMLPLDFLGAKLLVFRGSSYPVHQRQVRSSCG